MLSEGDTFGINGSLGVPEKKFGINFSKVMTNFAWCCIIMVTIIFVNGK